MSEPTADVSDPREARPGDPPTDSEDRGTLTVEDEPGGTVNPADLAGTSGAEDATVGYEPESTAEPER